MKKTRSSVLLLLLSSFSLPAGPLDDFAGGIEGGLDQRCVGYGYAIYQNGAFARGGGGGVRHAGDPDNIYDPGQPFDENTVKDCHSISKTVTAAALLKALGDASISPDAMMWSYLLDEDYYRQIETDLALQPDLAKTVLENATASHYADFVRSDVFGPAGLPTIHPRPVQSTLPNFAWYYDQDDPTVAGELMPDRRLTVGSGGWAISAKQYGKFIAGLFNNQIVSGTQLGWMQSGDLAMFDRTGSNGSDTYYSHNGATTSGTVGGRSVWMAFPGNIQAVVQLNSARNSYEGYGVSLDRIVQEAYENAYSTPPSEKRYPGHFFVRRGGDGWTGGRGVGSDGGLGARNFDGHWPVGFTHARFLDAGGQAYVLHYKADNGDGHGRAIMQRVDADGTLGKLVFDSSNWLAGWTRVETFKTMSGTFLLLHNEGTGRVRTVEVSGLGTLGSAITDTTYSTGFDVAEILDFGGDPHLFRHNTTSGLTHLRRLNDDGSVGGAVYSQTWSTAFTDFQFYRADGTNYLLRYNPADGHARIVSFGNSLDVTHQVLDDTWSTGWDIIRYATIGSRTFQLRYNSSNGKVRMQDVNNDGTLGDEVWKSDNWLLATAGTGVFNPPTSGWTEVEFYDATPGFGSPDQVAMDPSIPAPRGGCRHPASAGRARGPGCRGARSGAGHPAEVARIRPTRLDRDGRNILHRRGIAGSQAVDHGGFPGGRGTRAVLVACSGVHGSPCFRPQIPPGPHHSAPRRAHKCTVIFRGLT